MSTGKLIIKLWNSISPHTKQPARIGLLRLVLAGCLLAGLTGCDLDHLSEVALHQLRSPSENFAAEADHLMAEGRLIEAVLTYRQAVESDPANWSAAQKLGQAYAAQGRRRMAQRYIQKALDLQPAEAGIKADLLAIQQSPAADVPVRTRWQTSLGEEAPLGLVLSEGRLLVSTERGLVQALDSGSGAGLWQVRLLPLASAPAAGYGMVFVGGQDGGLMALDAVSGAVRWRYQTGGPVYAAAVLDGEQIYCASSDGTLYALNARDGKLIWKFKTGGALHAPPLVAGGAIYFGSKDTRLYSLDAQTGQPRWRYGIATHGPVESQPALAGGRIFAGSGDSRVYALDPASGGEFWRYSFPDAIHARPLVEADVVYLASSGKVLVALDTLTGAVVWEIQTHGPLNEPPLLLGDMLVYFAAGDPTLYAVERRTGKSLWQVDTGDWISFMTGDGGSIHLAGKDGTILSIR